GPGARERPYRKTGPRRDAVRDRPPGLRAVVQADPLGARRHHGGLLRRDPRRTAHRAGGFSPAAYQRHPAPAAGADRCPRDDDADGLPGLPQPPGPRFRFPVGAVPADRESPRRSPPGPAPVRGRSLHPSTLARPPTTGGSSRARPQPPRRGGSMAGPHPVPGGVLVLGGIRRRGEDHVAGRPRRHRLQPQPDRAGAGGPTPVLRQDHGSIRGSLRRRTTRSAGGVRPETPLPSRIPGRALHLPLPRRARPPRALPPAGVVGRCRRRFHDLALPTRPDGAADDRRQDRNRRLGGGEVPAEARRTEPGIPRPPGPTDLPGSPLRPSRPASGNRREDAVQVPALKPAFSRFFHADPERLHAAAHSHHPWPDVTYDAHMRAWEDAARLADDKWDRIFGELLPSTASRVARVLGLADPGSIVFAPNTHELVVRIASNLDRPFRVLTTDAEFHSFARQLRRWEEEGIARAARVPAQPFDTFPDRLVD